MLRIRRGASVVQVCTEVAAPIQAVFDRITDHEAMAQWPGISRCTLIAEGTPRNGVGAVRRITAFGLTLDEKVTAWQPPDGYDYQIVRGVPVDHHGIVRLRAKGRGRTEVEWTVELKSKVPLVAEAMGAALRLGLPRALRHFAASFAN